MKGKKTGGRQLGTPNKNTSLLKDAILVAAQKAGEALDPKAKDGLTKYLTTQATANPTAFMSLLGKVLPLQVNHAGNDGGPIQPSITVQIGSQPSPQARPSPTDVSH